MEYAAVNVDRLQHWVNQGRLVSTPERPITARELLLSGCVHDVKDGIKILGDVRLSLARVNSVDQAHVGKGISPQPDSRSLLSCVQICNYGYRTFRGYCLLQILQPPCPSRLRRCQNRQDSCCTDQEEGYRCVYNSLSVAPPTDTLSEWYTHWGNRGYLSPQAIKKMPYVDDRLKELSREFTTFKSQPFETK